MSHEYKKPNQNALKAAAGKTPRVDNSLLNNDQLRVTYCFRSFDKHFQLKNQIGQDIPFIEIAERLKQYSQKTWGEIMRDSKRDHKCDVAGLSKEAQKRLVAIKMDDIAELWRFRFTGTQRLWGIREGHTFRVLWWDPNHEIYPSGT